MRRNHLTGLVMLCAVTALVVTGYALYYASSENLRLWVSVVHWGIGLAGIPALVLHMLLGKRNAAKSQLPQHMQRQRKPLHLEGAKKAGV